MTAKARVKQNPWADMVNISIMTNNNTALNFDIYPQSVLVAENVEPAVEPLKLPTDVAKALLDALLEYFGQTRDAQLQEAYLVERKRVTQFIDHLTKDS